MGIGLAIRGRLRDGAFSSRHATRVLRRTELPAFTRVVAHRLGALVVHALLPIPPARPNRPGEEAVKRAVWIEEYREPHQGGFHNWTPWRVLGTSIAAMKRGLRASKAELDRNLVQAGIVGEVRPVRYVPAPTPKAGRRRKRRK